MTKPLDEVVAGSRTKMNDQQRIEHLYRGLSSAVGYMLNAKFDLEAGSPKRTALMTIEGGIQMARQILSAEELQAALRDTAN